MSIKTIKRVLEVHVKTLGIPSKEELKEIASQSPNSQEIQEKLEKRGKYVGAWNLRPSYNALLRAIHGDETLLMYIQDGVLKIDAVTFGERDGD